jgi:steroid 5-alpha reductase family enzyme
VDDFSTARFLSGMAITAGVVLGVFVITWLIGVRLRRFNVVDVAWGIGFVLVAVTSFIWSSGHGHVGVRVLTTTLTSVWGLRLAAYIGVRSRGKGEDPRYDEILDRATGNRTTYALMSVYLVQAVVLWFIALPVQAAMYVRDPFLPLVVAGTVVWAVGMFFESVGDLQMSRFRANAANHGHVMDRGLWRYTRHPNYFGDACVWLGLYLIGAQHWIGALTVLSPVLMTWFLAFKTGGPLLERHLSRTKPGYADYMRRTSSFIPMPPDRTH